MKFGTKAIKAGVKPDPSTGAIMTPIYQTSTYVQTSPGEHKGYEYSRTKNPTRTALEESIATLEGGVAGFAFASGMSAIDTVMRLLKPGDEVIATNDLYGGSYRLFTKIYQQYGIVCHFVDMSDIDNITAKLTAHTKLVWVETPTNPLLKVIDIKAVAESIKKHEALLCVDNTFATPYLQRPIELGADIVIHSATKYLAGHSDVVLGAVVCNSETLAEKIAFIQNSVGAIPGPMDSFLTLRGIKTLHLRLDRHSQNAAKIASFLQAHERVGETYYPGLTTHSTHQVASAQMDGFGGMVSFTLKSDLKEDAIIVLENLKVFTLAESLGGVESLAGHPATMTHASIPREERLKAGLKDSLIRLSVGVEDIEDLMEDLDQALNL